MRLQYCSDLHLEFQDNREFLKSNPLKPKGEILLLAGDIVPFAVMDKHTDFFDYVSDHFETTYWVPGNHEYYYSDIAERSGQFNEKVRSNVFLVNNLAIKFPEVKLIFTTLWAKINPAHQWTIQKNMSDFQVIKYHSDPFTPFHFNQLYKESLKFLQKEMNQVKSIVVTHHVPTFLNYPIKYKGDLLNEAFAVELHDFIQASACEYWIFGHHHTFMKGFIIGKTNLICNQLGYVNNNEHLLFDTELCIEI